MAAVPDIYHRPVELLQRLIRFDTTNPPGNEAPCVGFINGLLTEAGFETALVSRDPARPNLVTRLQGRGEAPPLLLYGHVDVVTTAGQAWQHPPFEGRIADGYVWGRGALDMKGGVAMMLAALLRARAEGLTPAGDVVLAVLSDEEAGGDFGARFLVGQHPGLFEGIRHAIGEFGGFSLQVGRRRLYPVMVAERQICWMRMTVRGPAGHGALPVRGGAMAHLATFLQRLDRGRLPVHVTPAARQAIEAMAAALPPVQGLVLRGLLRPALTGTIIRLLGERGSLFEPLLHNTVNATMVRGGDKINVVPGEISLEMDGRLLPGFGPDDLIAELRGLAGEPLEIEVIRHDPAPARPDMGLFDLLASILREADPEAAPVPYLMPGVTDGRFFARLGIQTYGYLPMRLPPGMGFHRLVHGADERIPVEAVDFGAGAIYRLLQRYGATL